MAEQEQKILHAILLSVSITYYVLVILAFPFYEYTLISHMPQLVSSQDLYIFFPFAWCAYPSHPCIADSSLSYWKRILGPANGKDLGIFPILLKLVLTTWEYLAMYGVIFVCNNSG